ncbi:MAG: YicC/YloC family endoribonuclease, partial [Nitrospiraceae bacterium]
MIRSMTGYGRREASWAGGSVTVEVRAVNHRFCEVVARLPRSLVLLEEEFKRAIQRRCIRGRIDLTVSCTGARETGKRLSLDRSVAKQYHQLLAVLKRELRLSGTIDLALLAGFRDIISVSDQPVESQGLQRVVKRLLPGALSDLDVMRRREGTVLARDIRTRVEEIADATRRIRETVPRVVAGHFERMKARVEKLVGAGQIDVARLTQELALFADRCDVSEELTRLGSHLEQFSSSLKSQGAVGRTLDFLIQEMGREVNTIGAKANDAEIAALVIHIKGEL